MTTPEITNAEKFNHKVSLLPVVTKIEYVVHKYTKNDAAENIFIQNLDIGYHKLVFKFPFSDFTFDFTAFDNAALATEDLAYYITTENGDYIQVENQYELYLNALYFNLQLGGLVTITGKKWTDQADTIQYTESGAFEFKDKKDVSVVNVTVINADDVNAPLDKLTDYYQHRYLQKQDVLLSEFIEDSSLSIKPGEMAYTTSVHGEEIYGEVTKMVTDLSGGFRSSVEVLGIKAEESSV